MPTSRGQITIILDPENTAFMESECPTYRWTKSDFINQCVLYVRTCLSINGAIFSAEDEDRERLIDLLLQQSEDLIPRGGRIRSSIQSIGVHPAVFTEEEFSRMPPAVAQSIREAYPTAGQLPNDSDGVKPQSVKSKKGAKK